MAEAVATAMAEGSHLLVQAGTGTGKSLAYLVPALLHGGPVVVATATIALQNQVVDRDLPALVDAVEPLLGRRPTYAILKGRSNYLCRNKVHGGMPDDDGDALFDPSPTTALGRDVVRLRGWADETETGDRDELDPGVSDRAWRQVSVTARECLGAAKCPYGGECFAELARNRAAEVEIVVTNHAMLAIDALESFPLLPEHDAVVVDEAHELVDRVTGVATDELTAPMAERAAGAGRVALVEGTEDLTDAAEALEAALETMPEGRLVTAARAARHRGVAGARRGPRRARPSSARAKQADDGARKVANAAVGRGARARPNGSLRTRRTTWRGSPATRGAVRVLRVAPLSVNGLLREALFGERSVVLTSATLELGGCFEPVARQVGLDRRRGAGVDRARRRVAVRLPAAGDPLRRPAAAAARGATARRRPRWTSSPRWSRPPAAAPWGCSPRCGRPRPRPRDARAARRAGALPGGGAHRGAGRGVRGRRGHLPVRHALALAGRRRARRRLPAGGHRPHPVPAAGRPADVGPRPGGGRRRRQRVHDGVGRPRGAAAGAGRRPAGAPRSSDRGVVAVLDSRLATARYAGFLLASLPPFWPTTDHEVAVAALRRLSGPVD